MASLTTTTTSDTITIGNNTGIQVDVQRSNDNIILSEINFERILDVVKQLEEHITTLECENNTPNAKKRKSGRSQPMKKKSIFDEEESSEEEDITEEDVFESERFTDENTTTFTARKEVNFAAVKTAPVFAAVKPAPEFIAVKIAPITKNPTTSNPHDHKSDMMKGGIAGENKGNQQMDWWDSTERIEFLIAMFEDTVEGAHIDILDGAIVDIATDPLTDHEVAHLLTSITFGKLCNILTPIQDEMRTNWNQDPNVLIAVSKSRVSQKEILIKFNVTDASNRVTTLKDMYKELYEMKEIELEQSMMNKYYHGNTDTP